MTPWKALLLVTAFGLITGQHIVLKYVHLEGFSD